MVLDQKASTNERLSESDRELLRDSVRDFLSARWPAAQAVEHAGDVDSIAALWRGMGEQGLSALGSDQGEGGLREIVLVFEELGRASCPAPMLGAVTANLLLSPRRSASRAAASLLDAIGAGAARVAAAYGPFDGDRSAGGVKVKSTGERGAVQVDGRVAFVESAAGATHFVVFTDAPAGVAIVATDVSGIEMATTPGLAVPALAEVSFNKTSGTLIPIEAAELEEAVQAMRLACAARAIGAVNRAFELAVEHAKVRKQFGQIIGQFQAVQHKLADGLMTLDGARLTLERAATVRDQGSRDWPVFASAALAFAGPALRELAIQVHRAFGAIGYAEEHEAPRHFRRVHADLVRFGGAPRARAELADYLLGPVE